MISLNGSPPIQPKTPILTERLVDGQVSLDDEHGSTSDLRLLEDNTTASVQHTIDTTDGRFRTLKTKMIKPLLLDSCSVGVRILLEI